MDLDDYLFQWLHAYVMHVGAWVSFALGMMIYKNGVPNPKELFLLFKSVIILALIGGLFSSNSQVHYLTHVATKVVQGEQ